RARELEGAPPERHQVSPARDVDEEAGGPEPAIVRLPQHVDDAEPGPGGTGGEGAHAGPVVSGLDGPWPSNAEVAGGRQAGERDGGADAANDGMRHGFGRGESEARDVHRGVARRA